MVLALFHSTIRGDEKLIIQAAKKRGVKLKIFDIRDLVLDERFFYIDFEIALNRSVSNTKGRYLTAFLEEQGVNVVNPFLVIQICEDKYLTSLALRKNNIPTVPFAMVFTIAQAERWIQENGGYPVVLKPALGSWGRLMAKVNDRDALEAVFEHKMSLQAPYHKAFYIQKYIEKNGRDIRAFFVGDRVICAIYRDSEHWITNTARGGKASNCPVSDELNKICRDAAAVVGGGILAMDVFETDQGYLINEINHTMEFKNSEEPTGVSISGAIVDYCMQVYKKS